MRGNPGALSALLAQAFDVVRMKSLIGGIQLHRVFDGNPRVVENGLIRISGLAVGQEGSEVRVRSSKSRQFSSRS